MIDGVSCSEVSSKDTYLHEWKNKVGDSDGDKTNQNRARRRRGSRGGGGFPRLKGRKKGQWCLLNGC